MFEKHTSKSHRRGRARASFPCFVLATANLRDTLFPSGVSNSPMKASNFARHSLMSASAKVQQRSCHQRTCCRQLPTLPCPLLFSASLYPPVRRLSSARQNQRVFLGNRERFFSELSNPTPPSNLQAEYYQGGPFGPKVSLDYIGWSTTDRISAAEPGKESSFEIQERGILAEAKRRKMDHRCPLWFHKAILAVSVLYFCF